MRLTVIAVICMVLAGVCESKAQLWWIESEDYIGLRVSTPSRGGVPVILPGEDLLLSLDANHPQPKDLRVELVHHDRNWVRTASEFINDPFLLRGQKPLAYTSAPAGIRSYRWTYGASVPSGVGAAPLRASGNYVVSVVDMSTGETVARFRFSVAERPLHQNLSVRRRRLPMKNAPWNEAHQVTMTVDETNLRQSDDLLYLQRVRVVDVFKNREWSSPSRIDLDALTPSTWIDGLGTSSVSFTAGSLMPGNEYRTIDIRNVERYPSSMLHRSVDGADVSRFLAMAAPDNQGSSILTAERAFADYERFEFRLWWDAHRIDAAIHVLGDFNGWNASDSWRLRKTEEGRFSLTALLKRGRYDYQYTVDGEPVPLEGNSWETSNLYTAVTYYTDLRLGGYDRILFIAQADFSTSAPKGGR